MAIIKSTPIKNHRIAPSSLKGFPIALKCFYNIFQGIFLMNYTQTFYPYNLFHLKNEFSLYPMNLFCLYFQKSIRTLKNNNQHLQMESYWLYYL